jgi:hypothetical protein
LILQAQIKGFAIGIQARAAILFTNPPFALTKAPFVYPNAAQIKANAPFVWANGAFGQTNALFAKANASFIWATGNRISVTE